MSGNAIGQGKLKKALAVKPIPRRSAVPAKGKLASAARGPGRTGRSSDGPQLKLRADITGLTAHDLVTKGVSVAAVKRVMDSFNIITDAQIHEVLGISAKTLQRRSTSGDKTLDSNASDRALRLVSVTRQAIHVLGSQEAAERWLDSAAIGLNRRRPIDLLKSTQGCEMVKTLLTRMEYGVYA